MLHSAGEDMEATHYIRPKLCGQALMPGVNKEASA